MAAAHKVDETMVTAFMAACSFQRLDVALVAGGTAEEWSDGDLTTVRGVEKLRDWIMTKSPRLVWFCCPAENSTQSKNCRSTTVQSRSRHQSREHRIQRHMSNLAAEMASSGQCDFALEIPWNSQAVRPGSCIYESLKGFHRAWVPACAWGLRADSMGLAEGGWRVLTSMRSIADPLVSRSCDEGHWHRPVERRIPTAASLLQLCCRLMPTIRRRPTPMELTELVAGATVRRRLRGKQSTPRRLTRKQPQPSGNRPQSAETVLEMEEHPILPTETEPWRPLTETEKTAWDALSTEEREVCDALVHRLH